MANANAKGYVFVFGLPYITNRISINSEHDLVNVRLLSICPPDALRPYFQQGYLAGTEDITSDYDSKTELDFRNRLIAKFEIPTGTRFWGKGFSSIPNSVLYPKGDRIGKLCKAIHVSLESDLRPGEIGEFLKIWSEIEEQLVKRATTVEPRGFSAIGAISILSKHHALPKDLLLQLDAIRQFRNRVVHQPKTVEPGEIQEYIGRIKETGQRLHAEGNRAL